jgi:hypothetical protein
LNESKFSVNAALIVFTVFTAILLFFSVFLSNVRSPFPVNEFYPIGDTGYAIRYSSYHPSGIYKGTEYNCTLILEGTFDYDWGACLVENKLYVNEYAMSDLGFVQVDLVCIDLETFEKETLREDTILRGACASGELVSVAGFLMPSNAPETNELSRLYAMSSADISPKGEDALLLCMDPHTGEIVYSARRTDALDGDFEARYLEKTLEEIAA